MLLAPEPALAQGGSFAETFDGPTLSGWERSDGVVVSDGIMRISPGSVAFRLGRWNCPTIRLRLRYTAPGEVLIRYHATDHGAYNLYLSQESLRLDKLSESGPTALAWAESVPITSGEWTDVLIVYDGWQHQVSLDQAVVLAVEDSEPLPSGAIGLAVTGANAADLDELAVTTADVGGLLPALTQTQSATPSPRNVGLANLIDELFAVPGTLPDLRTSLVNLGLAAVLAYILGRVYIYWGASLSNRRRLAANFVIIAITTTFIIQVVRSSVALSLGLVGALSIVRFRAAIKEPEELAYIFLCVALGIGLGDNQRLITILALTVAVAIVGLMKALGRPHADSNLHLTASSRSPTKLDPQQVMRTLSLYCPKCRLLRLDENGERQELSFLIELREMHHLNAIRAAIRSLSDSAEITFLDSRGMW